MIKRDIDKQDEVIVEGNRTDAITGEARDYTCFETSGRIYVEGR